MRPCPTCKRKYSPGINFCPEDGTPLAESDPLIGTTLLGQFELLRICGTGSMGTVYKARQATMDRFVAVKILRRDLQDDPQVVKRFQREARAAARLSHPNIITVYLVGATDDGRPFMVMEFVEGQSLEDLLREAGALPPVRAMHIARQIASALAEAHGNAIIHRDLKPANILLTSKRTTPDFVKVLDFGIAKILYEGDETQLTQTGAIFGTPYYISPEQASGAEIDPRCDLYSLGVILFRMLAGRLPFESPSGMEVLIQHLKQAPPRLRDLVKNVPAALEDLVIKAMAKQPDQRHRSAEDLVVALDTLGQEFFGGAQPTPVLEAAASSPALDTKGDASASAQRTITDPELRIPLLISSASTRPAETPISSLAVHRAVEATMREQSPATAPGAGDTDWLAHRVVGRRRHVFKHLLLALLSVSLGSALGAGLHYRAQAQTQREHLREAAVPPAPATTATTHTPNADAAATAKPLGDALPQLRPRPTTRPAWQAPKIDDSKAPRKHEGRRHAKAGKRHKARKHPKTATPKGKSIKGKSIKGKSIKPKPADVDPLPVPRVGSPASTGDGSDHGSGSSDHDGSDHAAPKPVKPKPGKPKPRKNDDPYDLVD